MDLIKAFVLNDESYQVNIRNEDGRPLFRAIDAARVLGIVNIRTSTTSYDDTEKVLRRVASSTGEQDTTFLTVRGMIKLIMVSRKPIAKPFQTWVFDVLEAIQATGRYELDAELQKSIQQRTQELAASYKLKADRNLHDVLLTAFKGPSRYVVYFGTIRTEPDGRMLVKIGSTGNLQQRCAELQVSYGSMTMFHVIDCSMHVQFERFMQHHASIKPFAYRELIHGARRSNGEVFLVSGAQVEQFKEIAKRNLHRFLGGDLSETYDVRDRFLGGDLVIVHEPTLPCIVTGIVENDVMLDDDVTSSLKVDATMLDSVIGTNATFLSAIREDRRFTNGRGHKLQTYSPDGRTLLRTYDGPTDAMRDPQLGSPARTGIKAAIDSRTVYRDRRWALLDRKMLNNTIQNVGETQVMTHTRPKKGMVAMLSLDRSRIVDVFCDMLAAAQDRQFSTVAAISTAVKDGRRSGGHRFEMWDRLTSELRDAYVAHGKPLPDPRPRVNSQPVEALHPVSRELHRSFPCIQEVIKEMHVGRASLQQALASEVPLRGFLWRLAP